MSMNNSLIVSCVDIIQSGECMYGIKIDAYDLCWCT